MLISWMLSWEIYRYILTTLCLNGTLSCVDFVDIIMGDIPIYNLTTLCLNGTLSCVDFVDVIMGDIPIYPNHTVFEWDTFMC